MSAGGQAWALQAEDLQTFYAKSHILHGVALDVRPGELVALLGRNGAGKTTTLRSLMGLTPPRAGRVAVYGQDVTGWASDRIAALGVGYVPEGRRVFANLSVEENLKVPLARPGPWSVDAVFRLFPRLRERRAHQGRQLSGGEQEMLAIGRALMLNPRLLLLDEPTQGLAPRVAREVFDAVRSMRAEGMAVLLVEQNVRAAVALAERVCVLDDGRVVFRGEAAEFARDETRLRDLAGASAGEWQAPAANT
jgi:branched-chain amino acid transport system ATP-binding protein